jgi:hypothetical protein
MTEPVPEPEPTPVVTPALMEPHELASKEQQLETIKTTIERWSKTQQIEVLKLLKKNPAVKLNENRNGVYINLSYLPESALQELLQYLEYVKDQESSLEKMEIQKEEFKSTFFLST